MILWTVIPEEIVMEGMDKPRRIKMVSWQGRQLLVEPGTNGRSRIVRLLSSDPNDFLDPEYAPGREINILS